MNRLLITTCILLPMFATSAPCEPFETLGCSPIRSDEPEFVHESTDMYTNFPMHGFSVRVSSAAMKNPKSTMPALELLDKKLAEVIRLTPKHTHEALRKVVIWVENNAPEHACACYHPDKQWLVDNGFNPDKEKGIEIANTGNFVSWVNWGQPQMVLHELAHAYHDQVLGFDNELIAACFDKAKASGRYEEVEHIRGHSSEHYALSNDREYFAELTESYFGTNDFEPFTRSKLKAFDPDGYAMIEQLWLQPAEEE